jgi:hypothetical protein
MKRRRRKTLNDYPSHLRGLPNNKYGGHNATNLKSYQSDWGKSYPCHIFSEAERRALEEEYRKEGLLARRDC